MFKKILFATIAMLLSTSVFANGYWEYREVCDYETITESYPYTDCYYNGYLWSGSKSIFISFEARSWSGHVSCPFTLYKSEFRTVYNSQTQQWESNWYSGNLNLYSTQHLTGTTSTTQVIEGSCRMERVWIPLCPRCQIP